MHRRHPGPPGTPPLAKPCSIAEIRPPIRSRRPATSDTRHLAGHSTEDRKGRRSYRSRVGYGNRGNRIVRGLFSTDALRVAHLVLPQYVTVFLPCTTKSLSPNKRCKRLPNRRYGQTCVSAPKVVRYGRRGWTHRSAPAMNAHLISCQSLRARSEINYSRFFVLDMRVRGQLKWGRPADSSYNATARLNGHRGYFAAGPTVGRKMLDTASRPVYYTYKGFSPGPTHNRLTPDGSRRRPRPPPLTAAKAEGSHSWGRP